jgi:hypothetical protein
MGWTKHVDWSLMDDFDYLVQKGEFDEWEESSIEQLKEIVDNVAYGRAIPPADRLIYDRDVVPVLAKVEDLRDQDHFEYLVSKYDD